ncbi:hypothetical protein [Agromyces kandeliae]|uniref:Nucleotidyltransferase family protein n=1 Tax=Agromyces kandeliae TaxID=2666141 RepID=A0A6L5R050_9MICO|nr:hypothetical protein [Agromyces kandeliae]MRX43255.1 hypothetical protein [Agromyces kandeliae]
MSGLFHNQIDPDRAPLEPEIVTSRRALIEVIIGLSDHREALTVLGGHAVIEVTQHLPALPPDDTTRDGDLGIIPQLLGDDPILEQRMIELGYETARVERPGVWSPLSQRDRDIHDRDSVDLIAPMSLSRGELESTRTIRAARVGPHGDRVVSATEGTELSLVDRHLRTLRAFDDGPEVDVYIAGPTALLCAKAYKLHDRMDPNQLQRNPDRLRAKDFADLYRLLLAVTPEDASAIFTAGAQREELRAAVLLGETYLLEILDDAANVAVMVADAWGDSSRELEFRAVVARWRRDYPTRSDQS